MKNSTEVPAIRKIERRRGINSTSYKLASDAYAGVENFKEAEIMALNAFINGEKTVAIALISQAWPQ